MAQSKLTMWIDGVETAVMAKSRADGYWYAALPTRVVEELALPNPTIRRDTLSALKGELESISARWAEHETKTEKRIVFQLFVAGIERGKVQTAGPAIEEITFAHGMGAVVAAAVYLRKTRGRSVSWEWEESTIPLMCAPDRLRRGERVESIPWTQDAEDRIAKLCVTMENITRALMSALASAESVRQTVLAPAGFKLLSEAK